MTSQILFRILFNTDPTQQKQKLGDAGGNDD